jgi:poly(A) polymerase
MPDSHMRRGAASIVQRLREKGHDAFFVGGAVRDTLLGRPVREFDIATSAKPDEVIASFKRTVPVGAQFGVILVVTRAGEYEVATFRAETSYSDGRHPDAVQFVSAKEDVLRRDFTINGLLQDPETGEIQDFVEGQRDLEAGVIRAIGNPVSRFEEDHLRILRAIRFATTLEFELHTDTLDAIISLAPTVSSVAAERIQTELKRTFLEGDPVRGYTLLSVTGVLQTVLPEMANQPAAVVTQGFKHYTAKSFGEVLSMLVPEILSNGAIQLVETVSDRLRLSRDDRETFRYCIAQRTRIASTTSLAAKLRFVRETHFDSFARVEVARLKSLNQPIEALLELIRLKTNTPSQELRPKLLLSGKDLMSMGHTPGPHFKIMLTALEDAQLEGVITTREEAVALVSQMTQS